MTTIEQLALKKYPPLHSYPTDDCEYNRLRAAQRRAVVELARDAEVAQLILDKDAAP